jgi:diguanylate cyclase (GGDEF)-like protein
MRPSRRVILLTLVAVACGALIVGVALLGLNEPERAVTVLNKRILPASLALGRTSDEVARGQQLFLDALASPPDARGAFIVNAQEAGQRAHAAWREYRRLAYGSPGERRFQHRYTRATADGSAAGATVFALVDGPDRAAYAAALTREQEFSVQQQEILQEIDQRFSDAPREIELQKAQDSIAAVRKAILAAFAIVLVLGLINALVLLRGAFKEERVSRRRDDDRHRDQHRSELENQLQRGLEMEPTEESTYAVIGAALDLVRPDHPVEVLVSDSSRAHFAQVLSTDAAGRGPGCPVSSPADCPAASSGQTRLFISSTRLDACPHLRSRGEAPQSAACIPISIAGKNTGMIHTTGLDQRTPDSIELSELELVARKAGDRIGFLRVLAQTEIQARVDGLTGLFNRRSVEERAHELLDRGVEFVVAFADLDHFKDLNDKHSHEIGDRALRLFGRVLRDSVRPADVPGRYGGEEFAVLLPDCTLADARVVANRLRERLVEAIGRATVPAFTVSVGLAAWEPPELFEDTLARADGALMYAKRSGRDRVVTTEEIPADEGAHDLDSARVIEGEQARPPSTSDRAEQPIALVPTPHR